MNQFLFKKWAQWQVNVFKPMSKFISLKIFNKDSGKVRLRRSRKIKRIYRFLEADKTTDCKYKVCVNYGHGFHNEGTYDCKTDAREALKTFMEEEY